VLGRETEIGSIAKGKRADLMVIHGNPEKAISDITHVETVFKDARREQDVFRVRRHISIRK
jgi:imidazolonepropionase-like amidohydrolase